MKNGGSNMNQWDEKYNSENYIYGKEPNEYVKSIFNNQTENREKVLLLAEGEGRNAIYLAKLGYDVTTYEMSRVGIQKQQRLAQDAGVTIEANYGDITSQNLISADTFDYSINIFGHVPEDGKPQMFHNLVESLVTGGHAYFEVYAKDQLNYGTGGPKDESMLYDVDEIKAYLSFLPVKIHTLKQVEVERYEGDKHTGKGAVIQGHLEKD